MLVSAVYTELNKRFTYELQIMTLSIIASKQRICIGLALVGLLYLTIVMTFSNDEEFILTEDESEFSLTEGTKVWIYMGLCYSHNTPLHGKAQYPYKEVTPLALTLWKYFFPEVSTIVQVKNYSYTRTGSISRK